MARRLVLAVLLTFLIVAALFAAVSWRVQIAPIEPPARAAFDTALIARGAALAALADCAACHTAADGKAYAGGYPLRTPFGTIYGTNITPDPDTGIGRWSQAAFVRAMREGVDRAGRHLYPAFPYTHFTIMSDEDLQALYAFMMTREPVRAEARANELVFPLNVRMLVSAWKMLFFDQHRFRADPARGDEWNRGAYLTLGPAHCGACHTPRNVLGAEKEREFLAGGDAEGWHAPALTATSRAPVPWTAESLFRYLRYGASETHEVAAGPMASVVHNLGHVPEQEVRAIATYIASVIGPANTEQQQRGDQALARARTPAAVVEPDARSAQRSESDSTLQAGSVIYATTCAGCHDNAARAPGAPSGEGLHLALSTSIALPSPGNLIRIILQGMAPPDGERGPFMPGFTGALTDGQVAALVTYLRATYTDRPAWPNVDREVRKASQQLAEREQ